MKKRFRQAKTARDEKIARHATTLVDRFAKKIRLRERIAVANRLARMHKKRTLCWTIGLLSVSLLIGIFLSIGDLTKSGDQGSSPDDLQLSSIANVRPMFDGLHQIQNARTLQGGQVGAMISRGICLKEQLDSLVRLPRKTHRDSAAIIVKYHQLEYLIQSIKTKEKR